MRGGVCYLVGAGPGDLGLVTLRARELIEQADVIIYDNLVNSQMLAWARREAELIYVGKMAGEHTVSQEEINALLVEKTRASLRVVRLKGGDPFIFGRGGEECLELCKAGCEFEVVSGVTAAIAAAAYSGIPLTHRNLTSSVTFITGHQDPTKHEDSINWNGLVQLGGTLVIYMGVERISSLMQQLRQADLSKDCPVAVVERATTGLQQSVVGTVESIAGIVSERKIKPPAIIIVGKVVELKKELNWFEKKPLIGQRIVLTRTRQQSSNLKKLLTEQGADVVELPMIQIKPMPFDRAIFEKKYDWLIFTSPNAVDIFFTAYKESKDLRALSGTKIAVVGPATGELMRALGIFPDLVPKRFTAQGLVEAWPITATGVSALFPCGDLAHMEIEHGLQAKGVQVERLEVYRTVGEKEDRTRVRWLLREEGADWIVFASSSAAEYFYGMGPEFSLERRPKLASLGPVTSQRMMELGYGVDYQAEESRIESLVEGLVECVKLAHKSKSFSAETTKRKKKCST